MNEIFTLRKGVVKKQVTYGLYLVEDCLTRNEIIVTISGKQHLHGFKLSEEEEIYVIVSPSDLSRGRVYSELQTKILNINFKSIIEKLDAGIDPLNET